MSSVYDQILAKREDMTNWLMHFTRANGAVSAREVLALILWQGVLRPAWAPRSGRPTIYGPLPAVCFTEQPITGFLAYVDARRGLTGAPSGYGVFVHKHDAYAEGAMPVIYGHRGAAELREEDPEYDKNRRFLNPAGIPYYEQYRYVAFAPTKKPDPIDWSHEREWRWAAASDSLLRMGAFALGGSGIFISSRGHSEGRTHVFVEHDADIAWLKAKVSALLAAGLPHLPDPEDAHYHSRWVAALRSRVDIISLETARRELALGNRAFARFETWPAANRHRVL